MIRRRGEKDYRYSVVFKDSKGCQTFVRFDTKKEAEKFINDEEIQNAKIVKFAAGSDDTTTVILRPDVEDLDAQHRMTEYIGGDKSTIVRARAWAERWMDYDPDAYKRYELSVITPEGVTIYKENKIRDVSRTYHLQYDF